MKIMVLSSNTHSLFLFRLDMMKEMIEKGHQVYAIGDSGDLYWEKQFSEYRINYQSIRVSRNGLNPRQDLLTYVDLYRTIRDIKPDRIFAYQAKTIVYGSLASYLNGVHEFYPLIAGLGSILSGKGLKGKIVRGVLKIEYYFACLFSAKVFFQNRDDLHEFTRCGLINERKAIIINGSGVNTDQFKPSSYPETITFLFVGRLLKDKGILEYLDACRVIKETFPQTRCLLVGPFDSNPSSISMTELSPYISSNVVEYFYEQNDVRPFICQSSVFVLPSYHEGTPKSVLEAMAMGRAIITTDAPGCRETVKNGVNGLLVEVKNVNDLVEKMEYFIRNPLVVIEMGLKSIEISNEKYDVHKVNYSIFTAMNLFGENT